MVSAALKRDPRLKRVSYAAARGASVDWIQRQRITLANESDAITALVDQLDSLKGGG